MDVEVGASLVSTLNSQLILKSQLKKGDSKSEVIDSQLKKRIMQRDDAKILLGFSPNSIPSPTEVKSAYRRKVLETHPDRFPPHLKPQAESNFKLVSEAYTLLNSPGANRRRVQTASYSRVVRTGVARPDGGRGSMRVASAPFILLMFGVISLAGSTASRAYRKQKEAHPGFNPFLP